MRDIFIIIFLFLFALLISSAITAAAYLSMPGVWRYVGSATLSASSIFALYLLFTVGGES